MQVRDDHARVILEGVKDPIAVVRVDVHIGHALQPMPAAQCLNYHAAVVEDTESSSLGAAGMMQSGDRHESTSLGSH